MRYEHVRTQDKLPGILSCLENSELPRSIQVECWKWCICIFTKHHKEIIDEVLI